MFSVSLISQPMFHKYKVKESVVHIAALVVLSLAPEPSKMCSKLTTTELYLVEPRLFYTDIGSTDYLPSLV